MSNPLSPSGEKHLMIGPKNDGFLKRAWNNAGTDIGLRD